MEKIETLEVIMVIEVIEKCISVLVWILLFCLFPQLKTLL